MARWLVSTKHPGDRWTTVVVEATNGDDAKAEARRATASHSGTRSTATCIEPDRALL